MLLIENFLQMDKAIILEAIQPARLLKATLSLFSTTLAKRLIELRNIIRKPN